MALPLPRRILLLVLLFSLYSSGAPEQAGDRAALLALRDAVGRASLRWNTSSPASHCFWPGVTCSAAGVVTALRLPGTGLMGQIPPGTVGNLTSLRTISLRVNRLSGGLPSDFAGLTELRNLYLQGNLLSGDFPAAILSLKNLVRLSLAENNFSGGIPPEIGNLTRLGSLYLQDNNFSGEIPDMKLPKLVQFNVSSNGLNGSIPSGLSEMPKDAFLDTELCGAPLGLCPGEITPSPAPEGPSGPGGSSTKESKNKKKKLSGGAIAGIAVGCAAGVLILAALLLLLCRKRSGGSKGRSVEAAALAGGRKQPEAAGAAVDKGPGDNGNGNGLYSAPAAVAAAAAAVPSKGEKKLVFFGSQAVSPPFDLEDLLRASAEVLGKGTFGTAYKAVLEMGTTVAVKRLKEVTLPEREFREKIEAVGAMDHTNLVPLRAYYFSKDEKLLVYDYMPMGSLSALLHGNRGSGRTPLNWETRSAIALEAACGIEYIHSTGPSASHGNIKSSNILLTKSYEARVSDHGLAHLVGPAANPTRVAGYRAPEVTDARRVSQKADVYSFGVLLLELLTGKAPAQALLNEEGVDLPRWVQSVVREEWTSEVFDLELLRYQNVEEEMVQLLQLAIDCAAQFPDRRPSMSDVVVRIDDIRRSSLGAGGQDHRHNPQSIDDGDDHSSRTDSIGLP